MLLKLYIYAAQIIEFETIELHISFNVDCLEIEYLEFDSRVFNVDCLVGTKSLLLWEHGEDVGWVKGFKPA